MKEYRLYINGEFVPARSGQTAVSFNPANGEPVAVFPVAGEADAIRAVEAARNAFDSGVWSEMRPEKRARLLGAVADRMKQKMGDLIAREIEDSGSTQRKAMADVALSISQMAQFARWADRSFIEPLPADGRYHSANWLVREPVGVCGQIIPWNFPLMMAVWKLGPALAMGNTVVLKPAAETPCTALDLAEIFAEVGLPAGVVNILPAEGAPVGETLVRHPWIDKVAFTGSTAVGRNIMAAAAPTLKKLTLELGGKSANLVLDDADLDQAVDGAIYACFFHAGQACESGTRLLLPESIHEAFLERLLRQVARIRLGDTASADTDMGPVVSERQYRRVLGFLEKGVAEGARLAAGGAPARLEGPLGRGWYLQPTVFTEVDNRMSIAQEEIFGPVLSVIRYKEVDQAIAIANDSIYGLGGAVWSRDIQKAMKVAAKIRTGTVWINDYHLLNAAFPFGGCKQSGVGREFGEDGLREYTQAKHVHVDLGGTRDKKFYYDLVVRRETK